MKRAVFLGLLGLIVLPARRSDAADDHQVTTVVYTGAAAASPTSLEFKLGDRLSIRADPKDLDRKLTGREVHVEGWIQWYERTDVRRVKKSRRGCKPFGFGPCYEKIHQRIEPTQRVWKTTPIQYTAFLELGPVLRLSTPAGDTPLPLQGPDGKARETLRAGGYVYVALHSGVLHFGQLALPQNAFDTGSAEPTPEERASGREWVQSQCESKPECRLIGEPTVTVKRGSVDLTLTVDIYRPQQATGIP